MNVAVTVYWLLLTRALQVGSCGNNLPFIAFHCFQTVTTSIMLLSKSHHKPPVSYAAHCYFHLLLEGTWKERQQLDLEKWVWDLKLDIDLNPDFTTYLIHNLGKILSPSVSLCANFAFFMRFKWNNTCKACRTC